MVLVFFLLFQNMKMYCLTKIHLKTVLFFFCVCSNIFSHYYYFLWIYIYIYKSYLILFVLSNNYHLNYLWAFNVQPPAMAEHVLMYIVTFFSYIFLGFSECLDSAFSHVYVFWLFFFFFIFAPVNSNLTWVHCSRTVWYCSCTI